MYSVLACALLSILCLAMPALGQSLLMFDVDSSAFPRMSAKVFALSELGAPQPLTASSVELFEDGERVTVRSIVCRESTPRKLSSVLVMDVSSSMSLPLESATRLDLAKAAARSWIGALRPESDECAITSFDDVNVLNRDFTTDFAAALRVSQQLNIRAGTNYNEALLNSPAGGLPIASRGRFRRVIVMLTDGLPIQAPNESAIIAEARRIGATIFCVTLSLPAPASLVRIATETGGRVFENVTTFMEADMVYRQILQEARGLEPCRIEWDARPACSARTVGLSLRWNGVSSSASYSIPGNALPRLEFSPANLILKNSPREGVDTSIRVRAVGADFTISSMRASGAGLTVSGQGQMVRNGTEVTVNVRFVPVDSAYVAGAIRFDASPCPGQAYVTARYVSSRNPLRSLRVVTPNGGEVIAIGTDTAISWAGISPSDLVVLDLSRDQGQTWERVGDTATGLRQSWNRVSGPPSNQCLVRASQVEPFSPDQALRVIDYRREYDLFGLKASPDGTYLATTRINTIVLRDALTGDPVDTLEFSSGIRNIVWSPGSDILGALSASVLYLWSVKEARLIDSISSGGSFVLAAEWSRDGRYIALRDGDNNVQVWTTSGKVKVDSFAVSTIGPMTWMPGSDRLAIGLGSGTITVRNVAERRTESNTFTLVGGPTAMSVSPDTRYLAIACSTRTTPVSHLIQVFDISSGIQAASYSVPSARYGDLLWSPDGTKLLTVAQTDALYVVDAFSGTVVNVLRGHRLLVNDLDWGVDGDLIYSAGTEGTLRVWRTGPRVLQRDTSDAVFTIARPRLALSDIDMGTVVLGQNKDSLVRSVLVNPSSVPFRIDSLTFRTTTEQAFGLVGQIADSVVPQGGRIDLEMRYRPTQLGSQRATLLIWSGAEPDSLQVEGASVQPDLELAATVIDFGRVVLGQSIERLQELCLVNRSTVPVFIERVSIHEPDTASFVLIDQFNGLSLAAGDSLKLNFRFTPSDLGRTNALLHIRHRGTLGQSSVRLFGEGIQEPGIAPDTVQVSIGRYEIPIGRDYRIPVTIRGRYTGQAKPYEARVETNPTVLSSPALEATNGMFELVLRGEWMGQDTLAFFTGKVMLGNSQRVPLRFSSFRWIDARIPTILQDGEVRVLDFCNDSTARLYLSGGVPLSLACLPNPASGRLTVRFGLAESGPTTLDLIRMDGRIVHTERSDLRGGSYERVIDVSALAAGVYHVRLVSGNQQRWVKIEVQN